MRRVEIEVQFQVERRCGRIRFGIRSRNVDRSTHAPVIHAAPAGAVIHVLPGASEREDGLADLTRFHIDWLHRVRTYSEAMHDVVRGHAKAQRVTHGHREFARSPTPGLRHRRVDINRTVSRRFDRCSSGQQNGQW